jgi:hypothetical protein
MRFNSLFNTKSENNILPNFTTKGKYKDKYKPQDFYYPVKFDPTKNNLSSISFRSKVTRFPSIKTTPHELDLEPYKHDNELKEHRVFNRPWLQQIQATLGDVFINDNTNDGLLNTAEIIKSLNDESNRCLSSLLLNKHNNGIHDSKTNNKYNKNLNSINSSIGNSTTTTTTNNSNNSIENETNEGASELHSQIEGVNLKNKNPYSECFFIKEPYPILTDSQAIPEEE